MTQPPVSNGARPLCRALFLLMVTGVLASCAYYYPSEAIRDLARDRGWRELQIEAPPFVLTGFVKPGAGAADTIHVYIEGDGRAWLRGRPPDDPTPTDPVALRLAMADGASDVYYLARPCQLTTSSTYKACGLPYWSTRRFSEEVVSSMNLAVDRFKKESGARRLVIVGYSGGGAVAALIAARRDDVALLITVAGTLDHRAWTSHHRVSPLTGSLNPVDQAARLAAIPQIHFVGADDEIVPPLIAESYMRALPSLDNARVVRIPGYDHPCCWARDWPALLARAALERPEAESRSIFHVSGNMR